MQPESDSRDSEVLAAEKHAFSLLASGQSLQTAFDLLLSQLEHMVGRELTASIWLLSEDEQRLSYCAGPRVPNVYRDAADGREFGPPSGSCGTAIHSRAPALIPDLSAGDSTEHAALLQSLGVGATWSTPIVSSLDKVLGTLVAFYPKPHQPENDEVRLMTRLAHTAGLLIERHCADDALRHSREQLRLLTDTVPALMSYVDSDRRYRFCNRRYSDWFGLPEGDIKGRHVAEVLGQEAWKEISPRIDAALRGDVVDFEAEVPYGRGGTRWVHAVYTPHRDEQGRVVGLVVMVSDMTASKRDRLALVDSEQRFQCLVEVGAAMVWTTDAEGTPREDAPSWRAFIGYRLDQYLHSWAWLEAYHPDDRERVVEAWRQALTFRHPYEIEARVWHADGRYRHVLSRALPLQNADGTIRQWVGMKVDVTDRKEAEAASFESERMLREATDAAQAVAWDMDVRTGYVRCKGLAQLIWGITEGPAEEFFSRVHPDDRELVKSQASEVVRFGRTYSLEYRILDPQGQVRWLYSRGNSVKGPDGRSARVVGVSIDITERKRAEAVMLESQQRYANLVNSIDGIVWEVDVQTMRFTFVSPQAERILGYPLASWYAQTFWCDHIHPDDRDYAVEYCLAETKAKRDHIFEYRMVAADGRIVWLRDIIAVIVEGDSPTLLRGVMVDITERKQAEEEIAKLNADVRRALEELQALMNVLPVGIFVARDRSCSTITMNPAGAALLGLSKDANASKTGPEANALPFRVLKDGVEVPPEDLPMQRVARTGTPVMGADMDVVLPQGEVRNLYEYAVPLFDEAREVRGSVGVFIDISERKRAEQALRLSEERFRLATAAGKVGIWEWDILADTVTWTESLYAIHGLTPGPVPLTSARFRDLVHPDDRGQVFEAINTSLATGRPFELEFRALRADDEVIWLFTNAVVLREGERPVRMIGATVDVTASKLAAQHLQSWNAVLEQKVGERTQELQQSQDRLRALTMELNLAEQRERKRLADELHDHLAQLLVLSRLKLGQAKRTADLPSTCGPLLEQTDDVLSEALAYTRTLVADLSPPVLHEFGLVPALQWLGDYMRRYELAVHLVIESTPETRLPEDQAVLLFQSVRELLMNAHKHARADHATVTVKRLDRVLHIEVRDEGQGFDPSTIVPAQGGIPSQPYRFGLFSIRERMRSVGGAFDVFSEPGRGTTATR